MSVPVKNSIVKVGIKVQYPLLSAWLNYEKVGEKNGF